MPNIIICANFDIEKLRGLGYVGRQILESPIEMAGHPYNSAALPCSLRCLYVYKHSILPQVASNPTPSNR